MQQVEIAGLVLGQQQQMRPFAVELRVAVGHAACGDIGLDADDGLDAGFPAGEIERHRAEHRAVVSQGQRRLIQRLGPRGQMVDAAEAVEQRELAVHVQMDEGVVGLALLLPGPIGCIAQHGRQYSTGGLGLQ